MTIEQLVTTAGDGILKDGSECSAEIREYFQGESVDRLAEHVDRCLEAPFNKSGLVLQDLVNELGRRLGFQVSNGIYQGTSKGDNYDGLWVADDGRAIVVEVKTTDTYTIKIEKIANYRNLLIESGKISEESSCLIVVGRQDTGEVEAQIRGSRHAWDTRMLSTEALISLVRIKESADEDETIQKIKSLLIPFENTRLDHLVDILFTAAKDVESAVELETHATDDDGDGVEAETGSKQSHTPRDAIKVIRDAAIHALSTKSGKKLIAHKRASFWSPDKSVRAVCTVSKRHKNGRYWYAYHPAWDDFLGESQESYFILGCVGKHSAYALPHQFIHAQLPHLHMTNPEHEKIYWHVDLMESEDGVISLRSYGTKESIALTEFEMDLEFDTQA